MAFRHTWQGPCTHSVAILRHHIPMEASVDDAAARLQSKMQPPDVAEKKISNYYSSPLKLKAGSQVGNVNQWFALRLLGKRVLTSLHTDKCRHPPQKKIPCVLLLPPCLLHLFSFLALEKTGKAAVRGWDFKIASRGSTVSCWCTIMIFSPCWIQSQPAPAFFKRVCCRDAEPSRRSEAPQAPGGRRRLIGFILMARCEGPADVWVHPCQQLIKNTKTKKTGVIVWPPFRSG